ncbi:hypothetical protein C8R44DRAFT_871989 [Mycena epipterygia]|nr:hypothetical protein C8R44DRAFT_871989 [Mycena epipterygia]
MDALPAALTFNQLATEVIDDILATVLGSIYISTWHAFVAVREALCLICKRWKDVIFGSARYWTKLSIYRYSNPLYIAIQLSRAKEAALSIKLELVPDASPYDYIAERVESVMARKHYPARTVVNLTMAEMRSTVLPIIESVFQRIELLEVAGEHSASWQLFLHRLWLFRAPNLRRAVFGLPKKSPRGDAMFPALSRWPALSDLALKSVLPVVGNVPALYANLQGVSAGRCRDTAS